MNDSPNYAEYTVEQKPEGKYLVRRILMIVFYVAFSGVWLGVLVGVLKLWPFGALWPVLLAIIVFFTWRFVAMEHEYVIQSGMITFTEVFGHRTRKKAFEYKIRDMKKIAPTTDEYAAEYADASVTGDFRGSVKSPDSYFFTYGDEGGKKCVVFFEATNKAIKVMRFYNGQGTVMSTTLRY